MFCFRTQCNEKKNIWDVSYKTLYKTGLYCAQFHHLPIIMKLSWYALPSFWMKGQKSTMQVSYSFYFPHDFCTVKFWSHLSQFFIIKSSRRIFYYLLIHCEYFLCKQYSFSLCSVFQCTSTALLTFNGCQLCSWITVEFTGNWI